MDDCRKSFENIYRHLYEKDGKIFPKFNGDQYEGFVQLQWDGWKSCWEQRNKQSDGWPIKNLDEARQLKPLVEAELAKRSKT